MTFTFTLPTLPFEAGEGLEKEGADAQDVWGTSASSLGRPGEGPGVSPPPRSAGSDSRVRPARITRVLSGASTALPLTKY